MAAVRGRNVSKPGGKYSTKVPQRCHEATVSPLRAYRDRSDSFGPGIPAYKKVHVGCAQKEWPRERRINRDRGRKKEANEGKKESAGRRTNKENY